MGWVGEGGIMLNCITIMGRLTRDPELRRTGSGTAVANFTVAVEEDYKSGDEKATNYIDCTAWRNQAEFISKYFSKGRMIVVQGSLKDKPWTDKNGSKHNDKFINVQNVYFGDSKRDGSSQSTAQPAESGYGGYGESMAAVSGYSGAHQDFNYPYPNAVQPTQSDYALLEDDDGQLPF